MAVDLYDLATLDAVFRFQRQPSPPFYLNFFTRQINFDTPEIMFDKVSGDDRGLAPFVMPNVQGRPQRLDGYSTDRFRPAYVKIKDVVNPSMTIERQPGEAPITGSMSPEQRRMVVIAELLRKQKVKFRNRNEWLAARALIDAEVTIEGEDYPAVTVSFGRHSSLNYLLTSTAKWDQSGTADPLGDIKAARLNANARSGARIQKFVFGADAWDMLTQRVNLRDMMDRTKDGYAVKTTLMTDGYDGIEYVGTIAGLNGAGAMECWVDTSKYVDASGSEQFFLDQKTVVGVGNVEGVRCFGAIQDKRAGSRPLDYFFKNWDEEDPSVEYLLGQSAPLMVPKNPNASFKIKVA
jgi:hypothetical protein